MAKPLSDAEMEAMLSAPPAAAPQKPLSDDEMEALLAQAAPAAQIPFTEAMDAKVAQGLTFGALPQLYGAKEGVKSLLTGGDFTPEYIRARDEKQARLNEISKQYPVSGLAAEVVPGMLTGGALAKGVTKLGPVVGSALAGFLQTPEAEQGVAPTENLG